MVEEAKTKRTTASVSAFIDSIPDENKRKDAKTLLALIRKATGEKPAMWGPSIVGFGEYHYKYATGREGDAPIVGFSPRKQNLTIYILPGYSFPEYESILKGLGPHSLGKSCLYIKRLSDIKLAVLERLVKRGYQDTKKKYKIVTK